MSRSSRRALAAAALAVLAGCGADPFGKPARVKTEGYRALVTARTDGRVTASYEIAARGGDVRRASPGGPGPVLLLRGQEHRALWLDPGARTYTELPWEQALAALPAGHPLGAGFDDRVEADRRGIRAYRRDSDEIFSGHACALWSFDDRPGEDGSPLTTYWVAPDLDGLVVRVERKVPRPEGGRSESVTELTNVRVGADPALFEVPKDYVPAPSR